MGNALGGCLGSTNDELTNLHARLSTHASAPPQFIDLAQLATSGNERNLKLLLLAHATTASRAGVTKTEGGGPIQVDRAGRHQSCGNDEPGWSGSTPGASSAGTSGGSPAPLPTLTAWIHSASLSAHTGLGAFMPNSEVQLTPRMHQHSSTPMDISHQQLQAGGMPRHSSVSLPFPSPPSSTLTYPAWNGLVGSNGGVLTESTGSFDPPSIPTLIPLPDVMMGNSSNPLWAACVAEDQEQPQFQHPMPVTYFNDVLTSSVHDQRFMMVSTPQVYRGPAMLPHASERKALNGRRPPPLLRSVSATGLHVVQQGPAGAPLVSHPPSLSQLGPSSLERVYQPPRSPTPKMNVSGNMSPVPQLSQNSLNHLQGFIPLPTCDSFTNSSITGPPDWPSNAGNLVLGSPERVPTPAVQTTKKSEKPQLSVAPLLQARLREQQQHFEKLTAARNSSNSISSNPASAGDSRCRSTPLDEAGPETPVPDAPGLTVKPWAIPRGSQTIEMGSVSAPEPMAIPSAVLRSASIKRQPISMMPSSMAIDAGCVPGMSTEGHSSQGRSARPMPSGMPMDMYNTRLPAHGASVMDAQQVQLILNQQMVLYEQAMRQQQYQFQLALQRQQRQLVVERATRQQLKRELMGMHNVVAVAASTSVAAGNPHAGLN